MKVSQEDISVVIILYNPSEEDKANVLRISSMYGGAVCDNSASPAFTGTSINKMKYIANGKNIGIAAAQNKALRQLDNYKFVVMLDQDSRLDDDYPVRIAEEYIRIKRQFPKLSILGPSLVNGRGGDGSYKSEVHKDVFLSDSFILCPNIIASGACVSAEVLTDVGLNEERLFIDLVDSEWCWRANSKGYICGMTTNVSITHTIGHKIIKIWKIKDVKSSPFRYFYQTRNYLWMLRRSYVPRQWKINTGVKYILRFFYLPFCADDGMECWKYACRGFFSGLKNIK